MALTKLLEIKIMKPTNLDYHDYFYFKAVVSLGEGFRVTYRLRILKNSKILLSVNFIIFSKREKQKKLCFFLSWKVI